MAENQRRQDQASNRRNARPLKGAPSQVHSRRDMVSDHSQTLNRTFVGTNVSRQTVGRPLEAADACTASVEELVSFGAMRPSNRQRGSHASTRVAILTPMISRENGGAASLLDLAQGFSSLGADVSLIATSDSPTRFMVSRNRSGILKGYDRRGLHRIRLRRIDGPPRVGGIRATRARLAETLGHVVGGSSRGDLTLATSSQGPCAL